MKKRIQALVLILSFLFSLTGCSSRPSSSLTSVSVWESSHSVFYAPQYAAMELGYFEEEGIHIALTTVSGDTAVKTSLASQPDSIGLSGPQVALVSSLENPKEYPVIFSQIGQRSGHFLLSSQPDEDFQWKQMKGTSVLTEDPDDMSVLVLKYILKKHGLEPDTDISILQSSDLAFPESAFSYLLTASAGQQQNGHLAASLGKASGFVPCTVYSAGKQFLTTNPDLIQGFTNGIQKGLDYIHAHSSEEIAAVIQPQFPDTDPTVLAAMIEEYKILDVWNDSSDFTEESFALLQNLLEECGILTQRVPYKQLVAPEYSRKAR